MLKRVKIFNSIIKIIANVMLAERTFKRFFLHTTKAELTLQDLVYIEFYTTNSICLFSKLSF